jgi:DNA helicase-2/ATP-dependent DNA helicase PcrA
MSKLNEEQIMAVDHFFGPCLVSACPGAGKTRVITHRAISLVSKGVSPSKILLVTFTNKAAREMQERISNLAKDTGTNMDGISIGTFHKTCLQILRNSKNVKRSYKHCNIMDPDDVESLLKSVAEDHHVSLEKEELEKFKYLYDSLREKALTQDQIVSELNKINTCYYDLYNLYEQAIINVNAIDFSGIMYNFWTELNNNNDFKNEVQSLYNFMMVDEVQDTNIIQFEIAKIITSTHQNIFMVGDTDQSIYQWRGANPGQVSKFIKETGCKVYRLSKNYRCTGNIANTASNLICNNPNRLNAQILAHREMGSPIGLSVHMTRDEEADKIARSITRMKLMNTKLKDVAILVRASHLTRGIEQALMRHNVAYTMTGGFRFYDREEIKDVVAMLKFINNPKDVLSLCRFMNKPKRGLGGKCVQFISSLSLRNGISDNIIDHINNTSELKEAQKSSLTRLLQSLFSNEVKNMSLPDLINHVVSATKYSDYINTFKGDVPLDKHDNIQELVKSVSTNVQSLEDFLTSVSLMSTPKEASEEDEMHSVKIMTMHAAKGLEFKNVFIPCFEENIIPHRRSIAESHTGIEEERRLAYVAVTRAMDNLYISTSLSDGGFSKEIKMPSRFLFESGLCDQQSYYDLVQEARNNFMV